MYAKFIFNWLLAIIMFIFNKLLIVILWIFENSINPLVKLNNMISDTGQKAYDETLKLQLQIMKKKSKK